MKQVRHFRVVPTKRGRKRILVNPKIIKKPKTKSRGIIKRSERKVFNHMSDPNIHTREFGGGIDFGLDGHIEQFIVTPGRAYDVALDPDFEVQYHTHPDKFISPPTPEDIMALLENKKQQAEMIFRNGESYTIIKTSKTKALSKLPTAILFQKLDRAFLLSRGKNWEFDYKKELEKLGFIVFISKDIKSPINVKIQPVEPKRRKK